MYEKLFQIINRNPGISVNPQQWKEFCRELQFQEVPKNCWLLEQGKISNYIYFSLEGIIRGVYHANGKDTEMLNVDTKLYILG
ncbi:hypothetical protein [Nostoc sp.]|uniref:hypothetical protein n=1 Tax=Nostoc sp. TaxID=1180 RepID=UPI002FF6F15F